MSRDIGATNVTTVTGSHVHVVLLAKLEFDTPVYVHSGYGVITYDSNDYLGVGTFGGISEARESELLSPNALTLELSGIDSNLLSESLDSATYGDQVTIFQGYRNDDGTLVQDPFIIWSGTIEYASIRQGSDNIITLTCQHDLAVLEDKDNSRFTDEDQLKRFASDRMFEYVTKMQNIRIEWAGDSIVYFGEPSGRGGGGRATRTRGGGRRSR